MSACGQGIYTTHWPLPFPENLGVCRVSLSHPQITPSQLDRKPLERERTVTKGKIDPILSRSLELLIPTPSSTLATRAKGHQGHVKAQLGSSWATALSHQAVLVRRGRRTQTDQAHP